MATLTIDQTATLKQILDAQRRSLVDEIRDELERSGESEYIEMAGSVNDLGDESVADLLVGLGATFLDRHVHELREVEAALRRIADGSYGDCGDCAGEIGFARLEAFPTATRCLVCQEQHEKTHASESNPTL
jgi:RNA polymerase-binding transcription factor